MVDRRKTLTTPQFPQLRSFWNTLVSQPALALVIVPSLGTHVL